MDKEINFLLHIKYNSLTRNQLQYLSFPQFKQMVYNTIWMIQVPDHISKIASDIDSITVEEVIDYVVGSGDKLQESINKVNKEFEGE
ncbi:MAG: hypothetical protein ACI4WG_02015 [Erysipelotrichaceae bacterium]